MRNPNVTLAIKDSVITFSFRLVPVNNFYDYLLPFKNRFPNMRWNHQLGEWQLPISEIKPLYELCRAIFYPDNVQIVTPNCTQGGSHTQLSIF